MLKNNSFPCENYFAPHKTHIQEASAPEVLLVQHPVFGMFSHDRIPIKKILGEEATEGHMPKAQHSLFSYGGPAFWICHNVICPNFVKFHQIVKIMKRTPN